MKIFGGGEVRYQCYLCKGWYTVDEFYKDKSKGGKRRSVCKFCDNQRRAKYYKRAERKI